MTTSVKKGIKQFIARYKGKFATMERFQGWARNVQQAYLWQRQEQLEEIIKDVNRRPSRNDSADKLMYRKIQRELKSKQTQFDRMDRLDYAERRQLSDLHPSQTTLEAWTISVCSTGPQRDI